MYVVLQIINRLNLNIHLMSKPNPPKGNPLDEIKKIEQKR